MEDPPPQRWDRAKWITVFSSHSPTIREITECLGLARAPSASTTNRGIPKFDAPESKKLSSEVQRLSKDLPKDREALLDFAADTTNSLNSDLDALLAELGPSIWGRNADRDRLLVAPDETKKTYYKDLFYEDEEDRDALKIHLHRWIIIKACYYIRNMKLKRPSAADDYDTVADMDVESPDKSKAATPTETPRSGTPIAGELATLPLSSSNYANTRKRKGETYGSLSDGEERASVESGTTAKRRLYSSATMPNQRKSPRKSLAAAKFSAENIPPSPSPTSQHQLPPVPLLPASAPDGIRPLLSPLTNNMLNGAARPVNPVNPSTAGSFAVANPPAAGGFTAVNTPTGTTAPPVRSASSYSSPYANTNVPIAPANQNGAEETLPPLAPYPPRDNSRHSTPTAHVPHNPTPPPNHVPLNPAPAPVLPRMSNLQPTFHTHSIAPAVGAPNHAPGPLAPMIHPLSNGNGVHTPLPGISTHAPIGSQVNGHSLDNRDVPSTTRVPDSIDTTLIQCELLGALMRYFFPRDGPMADEAALLQNLEYVWHANEPTFRHSMGRLFEGQRRVLFAWITERRSIGQLQRQLVGQPGLEAPEMVGRLLAMNDLRVMRLKWKAMKTYDGGQNWSPEDLLCKTFATMTKTEGTEHLFKDGLNKLNESVFAFLKTEDMKISMIKRLE